MSYEFIARVEFSCDNSTLNETSRILRFNAAAFVPEQGLVTVTKVWNLAVSGDAGARAASGGEGCCLNLLGALLRRAESRCLSAGAGSGRLPRPLRPLNRQHPRRLSAPRVRRLQRGVQAARPRRPQHDPQL